MDSPPGASSRLARGMSTAWEGDDPRSTGWTRREWAKLALAAGAASSVLAMGGTVAGQLLPPPAKFQGELRQEIYYTKWPRPTWWDDRQGRPILATDFQEWQGASGVWRGLFVNERWVPGTGLAVLVIRVKYDATEFQVSTDLVPPRGFSFYHDDPRQRIRLVVFADRCTHLCCPPGWHVITDTVPDRAYRIPPPTYSVYGQDPIFCICHGSQYDPLLLTTNVHPRNGVPYLGATHVHGPTQRALPIVPVRVEGEGLVRRSGPDAIGSERASSPEPRRVPARWWGPRPILSFSLRPLVRRESYASRSCIFHSPRTYGGIASRGRTSA